MSMQTEGSVDEALNNLSAMKSGKPVFEQNEQPDEIKIYDDPKDCTVDPSNIQKQRVIDLFITFCNIIEPEHPYIDDPYPIKLSDVESTHCKSSGRYIAKCGPRSGTTYKAHFSIDRKSVESYNIETVYRLLVHELTHIEEGSHTHGSTHNPLFWKCFAENAVKLYHARPHEHDIDWSLFFTYCRNDPNKPMTDKRMRTVEEQKQEVEDEIWYHL